MSKKRELLKGRGGAGSGGNDCYDHEGSCVRTGWLVFGIVCNGGAAKFIRSMPTILRHKTPEDQDA